VTFIDTPGADPGLDSEERGQSEAIARDLLEMAKLRVPVVSVVIGEGGSGGALAIGVCDRAADAAVQHHSVISPEGCASILWKSATRRKPLPRRWGSRPTGCVRSASSTRLIAEPLGARIADPP
jgi:acetyl-CoA carboxylase carboxyl transferase subunit alpha